MPSPLLLSWLCAQGPTDISWLAMSQYIPSRKTNSLLPTPVLGTRVSSPQKLKGTFNGLSMLKVHPLFYHYPPRGFLLWRRPGCGRAPTLALCHACRAVLLSYGLVALGFMARLMAQGCAAPLCCVVALRCRAVLPCCAALHYHYVVPLCCAAVVRVWCATVPCFPAMPLCLAAALCHSAKRELLQLKLGLGLDSECQIMNQTDPESIFLVRKQKVYSWFLNYLWWLSTAPRLLQTTSTSPPKSTANLATNQAITGATQLGTSQGTNLGINLANSSACSPTMRWACVRHQPSNRHSQQSG